MAVFDALSVLTFENMGRQYALRLTGAIGSAPRTNIEASKPPVRTGHWRKLAPASSMDTEYFRHCLQRADTAELRQFLMRGGFSALVGDNAQLFLRIAELVRSGQLELSEWVSGSTAGGNTPQPVQEYVQSPPNVCPADLVVNKPPKPVAAKPAAVSLDPKAQANVLVEAAQRGMPFCELCWRT